MGVFQMLVFASGVGVALFGVALHTTHRSQAAADPREPEPPPGTPGLRSAAAVEEGGGAAAGAAAATPDSAAAPRRAYSESSRLLGS